MKAEEELEKRESMKQVRHENKLKRNKKSEKKDIIGDLNT